MSCAASHCDVGVTVVAQVALVKISCEIKLEAARSRRREVWMRDGGVDGESANSRRVLESLVFRPILPGPPPLGIHLFAWSLFRFGSSWIQARLHTSNIFSYLNSLMLCDFRSPPTRNLESIHQCIPMRLNFLVVTVYPNTTLTCSQNHSSAFNIHNLHLS
jgi:hypothetical protein